MSSSEPFMELEIPTAKSGFYKGYNLPIAVISKSAITLLVLWALVWPVAADGQLNQWKLLLLNDFNAFYIIAFGLFTLFLFLIAIIPQTGKKVLGPEGVKPEFSNFSWFSMMFGAGLGVGLMVYATAEPLGLWGSNPEVVAGNVAGNTEAALASAFKYTFLHYGFHAWAVYVVTGLSLAYYAYRHDMPLTIRSTLTPLLGRFVNGLLGDLIDVFGVVATILGVGVTIGFGISQFVEGLYAVTGIEWIMNGDKNAPAPSAVGLISALFIIMSMSILSAVSGVGRGVKYLSNLNMVLSLILLLVFIVFGSFAFAMTTYGMTLVDYLGNLLNLGFNAYLPQSEGEFFAKLPETAAPFATELYSSATNAWGSLDSFQASLTATAANLDAATVSAVYDAGADGRLFNWQSGWTTFYWAWWVAFAPFVGLFLARISKGRSVREFVLGAVIAPSLVCFAWMTILGGTAIDLELNGDANGAIISASLTAKLFVTLEYIVSNGFYVLISAMCVVLIMTFLVTTADSGILVMNTIMSGGSQETGILHRIIWGILLTLLIGALIIAGGGGLEAMKSAMIIGALPFAIIMVLMCVSLAKVMYMDSKTQSGETTQS